MKAFSRRFLVEALERHLSAAPLLGRLLEEWQLPGPDADRTRHGLRLAVRDGYLNFYAKGQSVAKLSIVHGLPRLEVHRAYLSEESIRTYRTYRKYEGDELRALPTRALEGWVEQALGHAGEEKRFVDDLVAANPGVIDLEMGLPGDDRVRRTIKGVEKRVAPRMDLVVIDLLRGCPPQISFWEAKCADNGELRAEKDRRPHIVGQLEDYVRWLSLPDRAKQVLDAYRSAAGMLSALAKLARKVECEALEIWEAAAKNGVTAVRQPGVVVGNYCTHDPHRENEEDRTGLLARRARTFVDNGHLSKLRQIRIDQAIHVEPFGREPEETLPILEGRQLLRGSQSRDASSLAASDKQNPTRKRFERS